MSNLQILELFNQIAASYTIKDEKKYHFQIIAYQNAADVIKNLTNELEQLYKKDDLLNIPGIGPTIKKHLEELFKTGKVKHFNWVKKNIPESVFELLKVPTFGPKKAYKLVKFFKLNNKKTVIRDIENMAKKDKISKIEGFGKKSQEDILKNIKEYYQNKGKLNRMHLPYAFETAEMLLKYIKEEKQTIKAEALGSLRRKKETVGDIDIAVATNNSESVINHFTKYPGKERIIEKGKTTASMLISSGIQVDLMTQPPESFGSLVQHFTGSKEHNIKLREIALKKKMSLSEYGIRKNNKLLLFSNEKDFYNALDMDLIPPEIREDKGEVELALNHKLPRLIELKDIKGDLHIHSSYSIEPSHDLGANSINEIINKAINLKYEYIGFSEHNPSISKHTEAQIYEILKKRNEEIEQKIKSNKNIRVFKMLEIDILPNGSLPLSNKSLELLDAFIVSVHSSFNLNKKLMTERIISALKYPGAKILGHPTGRMINERPSYDLDWDIIFDFCKKNYKAIEINCWPKRLDPPDYIIMEGLKNNVKFVINSDSHSLEHMNLIKYGVFMAKRGWTTKNDILNTLSYNKFYEWLKRR